MYIIKIATQNVESQRSLTGRGHLQESNNKGSLSRKGPDSSTLWKIMFCMQFLSYDTCMCRFMLTLGGMVHIASIEIRSWRGKKQ